MHQARLVRDAEKAKPGIVRKTVEDRLEGKQEPTRADVKRAVQDTVKPRSAKARPRAERAPKAARREERIEILSKAGLSANEIAAEVGLGLRAVHQALEHVEIKREAEARIDPATLSLTAQEKLAAAARQQKRELAAEKIRADRPCRGPQANG